MLKTRINWKAYENMYLSPEQVVAVSNYDKSDRDGRVKLWAENGDYPALFCTLVAKLTQPEHLKYVLVLVEELLEDFPLDSRRSRIESFLALRRGDATLPLAPFCSQLAGGGDQYVQYLAAQTAGTLLAGEAGECDEGERDKEAELLMRWILATLRRSEGFKDRHGTRAAMKCLQQALQRDSMRERFAKQGGLAALSAVLTDQFKAVMAAKQQESQEKQSDRDLQLIYETLFCGWLLSYSVEVAEKHFTGTLIVVTTVRLMREVDKEKIRRVGLAMLRNLAGKAEHEEAMIQAGFFKVAQQLAAKRWGDDDIVADVQFMLARMESKMIDMTNWDRYKQELLSGQLEWSPPHKSDKFWRENFPRFNERNFELVGVLATLLRSVEPLTVAIACHDLGEFSRHHPMGKKILHEHDIKNRIMGLIDSKDLTIQQQALLALQKIMVANWEYLSAKQQA